MEIVRSGGGPPLYNYPAWQPDEQFKAFSVEEISPWSYNSIMNRDVGYTYRNRAGRYY